MSAYMNQKPGASEAERVTETRTKILRAVNSMSAHLTDSECWILLRQLEICMVESQRKLEKNKMSSARPTKPQNKKSSLNEAFQK